LSYQQSKSKNCPDFSGKMTKKTGKTYKIIVFFGGKAANAAKKNAAIGGKIKDVKCFTLLPQRKCRQGLF
jgi:hypothetical protein